METFHLRGSRRGTNQHFPITRQVRTLSHSPSPSTVGAHIWSDVIRKTAPQTKRDSYAIFITLLPYQMTVWINCGLLIDGRRGRVCDARPKCGGAPLKVTRLCALCLHVLSSNQETQANVSRGSSTQKLHLNKCLRAVCCGASSWHPNLTWGAGARHWPRQQKQCRDRPLGRSLRPHPRPPPLAGLSPGLTRGQSAGRSSGRPRSVSLTGCKDKQITRLRRGLVVVMGHRFTPEPFGERRPLGLGLVWPQERYLDGSSGLLYMTESV